LAPQSANWASSPSPASVGSIASSIFCIAFWAVSVSVKIAGSPLHSDIPAARFATVAS